MNDEPRDELDRLYSRIELDNPRPNFTGRVMARVRAFQRIQRISAALSLLALAALGVFAFALGRGLTFSGVLDYVQLLLNNLDVAIYGADDIASALLDAMPWDELLAVIAGIVAVWLVAVKLPRSLSEREPKAS